MEWKLQPLPQHVNKSSFRVLVSISVLQGPYCVLDSGYDKTYTAAQWYEQYWSYIQLNLEGTVLAFNNASAHQTALSSLAIMCRRKCQPAWANVPSQTWSTEAIGPLSLSTADTIACDVGHFVFWVQGPSQEKLKTVRQIGIAPS